MIPDAIEIRVAVGQPWRGPVGAFRLPGVDPSPEIPEPTVPSVDPTERLLLRARTAREQECQGHYGRGNSSAIISGTVIAPRLYGSRRLPVPVKLA
jgi:hypothetical protein